MASGLTDQYGRPLRNQRNFDRTANAFRQEAQKARRAASSIPGTIARGIPGLAPVAAIGAGLAAGAAVANIGFNAARDYLGNRRAERGPEAYTEGSVSSNPEQADRQAQVLLQRYADEADRAASTREELDRLGVSNISLSEVQTEEARQNMFLSMNRKAMEAEREELAKRQPYLSASRFRESMPTAINAASANFQAMLNSFQGYR